jgi:hypothetical protein
MIWNLLKKMFESLIDYTLRGMEWRTVETRCIASQTRHRLGEGSAFAERRDGARPVSTRVPGESGKKTMKSPKGANFILSNLLILIV